MTDTKNYIIGTLILLLLATGIIYISMDNVKLKIDTDKATFYVKNDNNRWVVAGREYVSIFDGNSKMNRRLSGIEINTSIDEENKTITITKLTPYIRGPVIKETYLFDGTLDDVEVFPISHMIEVFNASEYFLRYEVRDLTYEGDTYKLSDKISLEFGLNMKVELHPDYRWAWIYKSGILKAQYDINSDYEVYNVRLFDPIFISDAIHLDENKSFISNVYNETSELDNIWTEPIYHNEYIRVTFEEELNSTQDITIYPRNNQSGNTTIVEVYLTNGTYIMSFPIIYKPTLYIEYLTNLSGVNDTFDLKVVSLNNDNNAYLEFDYIVDPPSTPTWTGDLEDSPDPQTAGLNITYSAFGHEDNVELIALIICRTAGITSVVGEDDVCDGGDTDTLCKGPYSDDGFQIRCTYETLETDEGTLTAYGYICDDATGTFDRCSVVNITTTTVEGPPKPEYSDYWDDSYNLTTSGTGYFNVTVNITNGTVLLDINNSNKTASNLSAMMYNASDIFSKAGPYRYLWHSWSNETEETYKGSDVRYYGVNDVEQTITDVWKDEFNLYTHAWNETYVQTDNFSAYAYDDYNLKGGYINGSGTCTVAPGCEDHIFLQSYNAFNDDVLRLTNFTTLQYGTKVEMEHVHGHATGYGSNCGANPGGWKINFSVYAINTTGSHFLIHSYYDGDTHPAGEGDIDCYYLLPEHPDILTNVSTIGWNATFELHDNDVISYSVNGEVYNATDGIYTDDTFRIYVYYSMYGNYGIGTTLFFDSVNITNNTDAEVGDPDTNFTIWTGSIWGDVTTNYLTFRCTPTQTDCEPDDQNAGSSQAIYRICNNGTGTGTSIYMNMNETITNIALKCDDDYTVVDATTLTTSNQTLHGTLTSDSCVDVSCWVDYTSPTSGGYFDINAFVVS